ncbi:MAG: flagellar protein FlaG [Gammaproteobacteria bacterium]
MVTNVALQKYASTLGEIRKPAGATPVPATTAAADAAGGTAGAGATQTERVEAAARIPAVDSHAFESAVKDITEKAQNLQRSLQFHVDEDSGRTIITVIDKQTEEVIRQIPPEEVLSLAEQFGRGGGLFVETEA